MPASLQDRVLAYIRRHELLSAGECAAVAVSGGADSMALLRLMLELRDELGILLSVAHFNHKIRGSAADQDEQFVARLAEAWGIEFHRGEGDTPAYARKHGLSLEAAARELRYGFFRQVIERGAAVKVMTAHTLDDQAETVLLRVIRGAGTRGLAGIYPKWPVSGGLGSVVRPLLGIRRPELEAYLSSFGQAWCEDASNRDLHHARNRVRHALLPLLEKEFNPAIRKVLADMAEIAREEEACWQQQLAVEEAGEELGIERIARLPMALQRRLVRQAAGKAGLKLDFDQVEDILSLIAPQAPAMVELPQGWVAERVFAESPVTGVSVRRRVLRFRRVAQVCDYQYSLVVPGEVEVKELGMVFRARVVPVCEANRESLLHKGKLARELTVRNWRAGDRFWPAHTRAAKKVKELLQERHITGPERALWPVVVSGSQIVWMQGFPVSESMRAEEQGVLIETFPAKPLGPQLA